jgi:hypothetical protein
VKHTYEQLVPIVEKVLEHYTDDLHKHDLNVLLKYDGPFIYGYRKTGTDLLRMLPAKDIAWKDPSCTSLEAEKILRSELTWVTYPERNTHFLYFDGKELHVRVKDQITHIWFEYCKKVRWSMETSALTV